MNPELIAVAALFLGFVIAESMTTGFLRKKGQQAGDLVVELVSTVSLSTLIQPVVVATGFLLASLAMPGYAGVLESWSFVSVFVLFLIFDDMSQYWWHRASHTIPWLYKLHRPHHNAPYMSIRMVYRNNLFYYCLMPGLWFSGALIYFGGAWVYAPYIVLKMAVIFAAHSDVRWDAHLYQHPVTARIMWLVERVISTPATHSAHHGKHADDGVTHYKGNYGNLLFFWDVLFGTAKITRQYPQQFGVENLPATTVSEQLFWPIVSAPEETEAVSVST